MKIIIEIYNLNQLIDKDWNPEVISPVVSLPHSKLTTNISKGQ